MKPNYPLLSLLCLGLSVPLWIYLSHRRSASLVPVVRFATFNAALNRPEPGALLRELRGGQSLPAKQIAEIVQRNAVDVLLLQEVDRDDAGEVADVLRREYLAVAQGGQRGIDFEFAFLPPVNTGEPSGKDLDGDGRTDGPGDAYGFGAFPGQYGMLLLSRYPILTDRVRTFRHLPWSAMPGALRPEGYDDATWRLLRLSSKTHADVPIGIGRAADGHVVHVLCSHPTPPVFDGPEDRNGRRNHDEIRFWCDYLTPGKDAWIVDDAGGRGGLAADAPCVVLGDLNNDPVDGDGRHEAIVALLALPRLVATEPASEGAVDQAKLDGGNNLEQGGNAALDTGDFPDRQGEGPGNLRIDYVLPARTMRVVASGVFWPRAVLPGADLVRASDHRLVWADLCTQ